jgi:phage terminase small subunit
VNRGDSSRAREASQRQCLYVFGVLAGKSKTQSALDAGYSRCTPRTAREKIETKPAVRALFRKILEAAGITDELLAHRIREGFDATIILQATYAS